jgi:UPF0755 protein
MYFKIIKYFLLLAAAVAAVMVFSYHSDINSPANSIGTTTAFVISPGDGVKKISQALFAAGLTKSKFHFELYISRTKKAAAIQAGTYELSPTMTLKEIADKLSSGQTANKEKTITIIPGWDLRDVEKYFGAQGVATGTAFSSLAGEALKNYSAGELPDYSSAYSILKDKPSGSNLEGYLFPDTYRIYNNASAQDVILKMVGNLDGKITPAMRADITQKRKTVYEIITLASIIEKEVRDDDDMKVVSGIFWNRLNAGWPLGSDATLSYIFEDNKAAHNIDETQSDSPYNTYRFAGLPPGPICNPSLAAITAAIYPSKTDYYYFLTDPATSKTIYAKTLEEQNRNKNKYLK